MIYMGITVFIWYMNDQERTHEIKYIQKLCNGIQVNIDKDMRHNLYYEMIKPFMSNNRLMESENFAYNLKHKNSKREMSIHKIYPRQKTSDPINRINNAQTDIKSVKSVDILDALNHELNDELGEEEDGDIITANKFRHTKKMPIRYQMIRSENPDPEKLPESLQYARYKMTMESVDCIEQVAMIKLYMILLLTIDYVRYRVVYHKSDDTGLMESRVEFKFYFYDRESDAYDKQVVVSVDSGILVGSDKLPIIVKTTNDTELDLSNLTDREMLIHLYLKALLLVINTVEIDLERANVNSFVGAVRGGKLYRVSIDDIDPDSLDLSLLDVMRRKERDNMYNVYNVYNAYNAYNAYQNNRYVSLDELDQEHNMRDLDMNAHQNLWVTDNILEALAMFSPEHRAKRRSNELIMDNRLCKRANRKRVLTPFSNYSAMIKNMYESDCLIGVMGGNTFLYMICDIAVPPTTGDLIVSFVNPLRGNAIEVDMHTLLTGMQRIGLVLDKNLLPKIYSSTIAS